MFFSIMDINNLENTYQSFIQILIQNPFDQPLTLVKRINGYAQQDVSLNDNQKKTALMSSQNSWMLIPQITLNKVHRKHSKKLYCINLNKQHEHENKSQQKNSKYHLTSQNLHNCIESFSLCSISIIQN